MRTLGPLLAGNNWRNPRNEEKFWNLMHMLKKNQTPNAPIRTDQEFLFKEAEKTEAAADFFQTQFTNTQESDTTTRDTVASIIKRIFRINRHEFFQTMCIDWFKIFIKHSVSKKCAASPAKP